MEHVSINILFELQLRIKIPLYTFERISIKAVTLT